MLESEISDLVEQIIYHRQKYYAGHPEISDYNYDQLEERLRSIVPNHPVFLAVGSEDDNVNTPKVRHETPMLSLAKTYDLQTLKTWIGEHRVIGSHKVDGNSLSLVYEGGSLIRAKTRGNGIQGEDVSEKVAWVSDCIAKIKDPVFQDFEIRGELYCSQQRFSRLVTEMERLGLERPSNPRNIVAGVLGRRQHVQLARFFGFFAFDLLLMDGSSPFVTEEEKFDWLKQQNFQLPYFKSISNHEQVEGFLERTKLAMDEGEIGIDGAVFSYNDISLHKKLGVTAHHPKYKMSFKWQGETAVSTIEGIEWNTSRLGVVTPVAVIRPVQLSGALISNVTLHNASHVKNYSLSAGDSIEIVRSGEVIPKFLRVVTSVASQCSLPSSCPACSHPLVYDDCRLNCLNHEECPAQIHGVILNWVRSVGIEDLSEKRLNLLIDRGLVNDIIDLYRLKEEDFLALPMFKEKMAKKLYQNIQQSKDITSVQFLTGLGIKGTGKVTWEALLQEFNSIDLIRKACIEEILPLKGFAEKLATQVIEGLQQKSELIDQLKEVGVVCQEYIKEGIGSKVLAGMNFVITGTFSKSRKELSSMVEQAGGKVIGAVSSATSVLLIADLSSQSSKAKKARSLGVELWTEAMLDERLG